MPHRILLSQLQNPLDAADGAQTLCVANLAEETTTLLRVPIFTTPDTDLTMFTGDGINVVAARLDVVLAGTDREFALNTDGEDLLANKLQFDVDANGICLSVVSDIGRVTVFGMYEGEIYDSWAELARRQIGLDVLVPAARDFLNRAS